jgi:hypothetical protein
LPLQTLAGLSFDELSTVVARLNEASDQDDEESLAWFERIHAGEATGAGYVEDGIEVDFEETLIICRRRKQRKRRKRETTMTKLVSRRWGSRNAGELFYYDDVDSHSLVGNSFHARWLLRGAATSTKRPAVSQLLRTDAEGSEEDDRADEDYGVPRKRGKRLKNT